MKPASWSDGFLADSRRKHRSFCVKLISFYKFTFVPTSILKLFKIKSPDRGVHVETFALRIESGSRHHHLTFWYLASRPGHDRIPVQPPQGLPLQTCSSEISSDSPFLSLTIFKVLILLKQVLLLSLLTKGLTGSQSSSLHWIILEDNQQHT